MARKTLPPHLRFAGLASLLIVIIAAVSVISYVTLGLVQRDTHALIDRDVPAMTYLLRLDRDLTDAQRLLFEAHNYISDPRHRSMLEQFDRDIRSIEVGLREVRRLEAGFTGTSRYFEQFTQDYKRWHAHVMRVRESITQSIPFNERKPLVEQAEVLFLPLHVGANNLENELYDQHIAGVSARIRREAAVSRTVMLWVGVCAVALSVAVSGVITVSIRNRKRQIDQRAAEQDRFNEQQRFAGRLNKAFEMAEREEDVLRLLEDVLRLNTPQVTTELLLADSSQAHLHQVASTDSEMRGPGCGVKTPRQCPAVRQGATLTYSCSDEFDACPYLRRRGGERCAATCVPLTIMGRTVGVLHSTGAELEEFDERARQTLSTVATRASERIGMLRAFARSQTQASTDPLTGLLNRRSFQDEVAEMMNAGALLTVAYCDLDHFKTLNDKHGHDTGDRALRLFSKVLRESVRPEDRIARWGGEEFVVALADVGVGDSLVVLERVRGALAQALSSGSTPNFTVSMGVSDTQLSDGLESVLAAADEALLTAKREGRDRIVVAGQADRRHHLENELDALFASEADAPPEAMRDATVEVEADTAS